ncbi:MAG TPA: gamma-glutamyl-phosphate reductase, partial [Alphaproteobacteria bacterium]|nr:gamma-glutamyl-phosphate reductase [Alphaproteobacteria bacterium]
MEDVTRLLTETRNAAPLLAAVPDTLRKVVLQDLAKNLVAHTGAIIEANTQDLARMAKDDPRYDRLLLNTERIKAIADDVAKVATLSAPTGKVLEQRK